MNAICALICLLVLGPDRFLAPALALTAALLWDVVGEIPAMLTGATIIFVLMALVFRNVYLVFKKSENATPFQKENVCRLRKIGIFSIAVPIVGFIMSIIVRLVAGDVVEVSVGQSGIFMGIVVLCLTQYFSYGAALEEDVDGLV